MQFCAYHSSALKAPHFLSSPELLIILQALASWKLTSVIKPSLTLWGREYSLFSLHFTHTFNIIFISLGHNNIYLCYFLQKTSESIKVYFHVYLTYIFLVLRNMTQTCKMIDFLLNIWINTFMNKWTN